MRTISNLFQNFSLASLADGLILALVAVFSICVHESCHGLMALALGDDTAKRMGRISLNPLHHVDWYGLVMMVIFKFGWAKGVPVNSSRFKNPKLGMALTALAGPVSNIILSFFGVVGYFATAYRGWESADGILYYVNLLFFYLAILNTGLAVFNLIPVPPLDGSKILAIMLPERAYRWLMRYERYGMLVLMGLLLTGVLDGPLVTLRQGLLGVISILARPIAHLLAGI